MNVTVNSKIIETSCQFLSELVVQLNIPSIGIAIAVNKKIVSVNQWDTFGLTSNDEITIIRATRGG